MDRAVSEHESVALTSVRCLQAIRKEAASWLHDACMQTEAGYGGRAEALEGHLDTARRRIDVNRHASRCIER